MTSNLDHLRENFHRPSWWVNNALPYAGLTLNRKLHEINRPEGCSFMDEDWDNLIILDGCRYDLFEETSELDGTLVPKQSRGSATPEFLEANFGERDYNDTVYVTSNPMYRERGLEGTFHETIDVWDEHWDEELRTVRPEKMVAETKKVYERYPDKRILSHFMQPHYPFIGDLGQTIGDHSGFEWSVRAARDTEATRDAPTVWQLLKRGEASEEQVWRAYKENLELALPHVEELLDTFDERTVVTSDHGNMMGEYASPIPVPIYGHPVGIHTEELVKIPWLVVPGETRKSIREESQSESATQDHSRKVEERLADLGYA